MDISKLCPNCMAEIEKEGMDFCSECGYSLKTEQTNMHALKPYTILNGKYIVGNVIGEGGFGITYIGLDLNLEIKVAIKEFYPNGHVTRESNVTSAVTNYTSVDNADYNKWREGFLTEARNLGKLANLPGIVGVRDFFQENNTVYIVMEYVEGITLKKYLKENGGKMSVSDTLSSMRPIIESLFKVHNAGIVHRDISPDNIMIRSDGGMELIDFGAAREIEIGGEKSLSVLLKPGYAPEEQYRSRGNQGPWSDVYAICATIYRCITGKVPVESMERLRNDTLEKPSALGVQISPSIEKALLKGMEVFAEKRTQNMQQLYQELYGNGISSNIQSTISGGNNFTGKSYSPVSTVNNSGVKDNKKIARNVAIGMAALVAVCLLFVIIKAISGNNSKESGEFAEKEIKNNLIEADEHNDSLASDISNGSGTKPEVAADGAIAEGPAADVATAEVAAGDKAIEWQKSYGAMMSTLNDSEWKGFILCYLDSDDIPELIGYRGNVYAGGTIWTCGDSGITNVSFNGGALAYNYDSGKVLNTYTNGAVVYDDIFQITNGAISIASQNSLKINRVDEAGNPWFSNGTTDSSNYYNSVHSFAVEDVLQHNNVVSKSDMQRALESSNPVRACGDCVGVDIKTDIYADYTCINNGQWFVAPCTGNYEISLMGASGGCDSYVARETGNGEKRYTYATSGATLTGNMKLTAGQHLLIIVGGCGEGVWNPGGMNYYAGGFNGGGQGYISGGGGGCTDVYLEGKRVAAAAGSSGSNFKDKGKKGRRSGADKNYLRRKNGENTFERADGYDSGGGGAGWYGGTVSNNGNDNSTGYGGVNGWDANYFSMTSEHSGKDIGDTTKVGNATIRFNG